jgi:hypothetical protein
MDGDFVNDNVTSASAAMMYSNARLHSAEETEEGLEATGQFVHADVVGVVILFDPNQGNMPTRIIWKSIKDTKAKERSKLLGRVHSTTFVQWTKFEGEYRPTSVTLAGITMNLKAKFERAIKLKWLNKELREDIFNPYSLQEIVKGRDRYRGATDDQTKPKPN